MSKRIRTRIPKTETITARKSKTQRDYPALRFMRFGLWDGSGFRQTAEMILPHGIVLPFVLLVAWLGPVVEDVIRDVRPDLVEKIRRIAPKFAENLIRFRNRFTGETMTTALTSREFYLAQQLADGYSRKEIAGKLGLSASQVAEQIRSIFAKLGINRKDQLENRVW